MVDASALASAAVERREASGLRSARCRAPSSTANGWLRLSALRLPFGGRGILEMAFAELGRGRVARTRSLFHLSPPRGERSSAARVRGPLRDSERRKSEPGREAPSPHPLPASGERECARDWAGKSPFADLAQNFGGVFAEARRGALRGHRRAVEHDRGADAGNCAAFGGGAFEFELHAAMDDLRIGEDLIEIVDRTGGNAGGFELVQKLLALELRGQRAELADQFGAMREPALVVLVGRHRSASSGAPRMPHSLTNWASLPVAMMTRPSATGNS